MKISLRFGEVIFQIIIDREVEINEELRLFIVSHDMKPDVIARFQWDWNEAMLDGEYLGEDSLMKYYAYENKQYALIVGNGESYQGRVEYDLEYKNIDCTLNKELCAPEHMNISTLIRFLPIRAIFTKYHLLFFHASQIEYAGKGIVFTAPSGTGKTTQSKLWKQYRNAQLICNDRTLIRKKENWLTYGYPMDGSEPVRSDKVNLLGCIVVLQQAKENSVIRFKGAKAITALLSNLVWDLWDSEEQLHIIDLLIDLLKDIPVYLLSCTKDEKAVECLERKLREDGIIDYE